MDARRLMLSRALLRRFSSVRAGTALLLALATQACDDGSNQLPQGNAASAVSAAGGNRPIATQVDVAGATPMRDRVAVIGLLNKRNGLTRDLKIKPGQALRAGDAIVRLRACEATAPWEAEQDVGAFVQLDVRSPRDDKWRRAFSGWLFRERPDRNVVQHPIYDVWVKSCEMSWPETGPDTLKQPGKSGAKASSAAAPGPADSSADSSSSRTSASAAPNND